MALFIMAWILCGLLAGVIGSGRGDGGCGWFIIGFILGPIGVIASIFAKTKDQQEKEKAEKSGTSKTHKKCPMCAEVVKRDAKICKHCSHEFQEEIEDKPTG